MENEIFLKSEFTFWLLESIIIQKVENFGNGSFSPDQTRRKEEICTVKP